MVIIFIILLVVVDVQILTIVLMTTAMVAGLHLRPVAIRVATTHEGRGRITGHLIEVPGKVGSRVGSQSIKTTGLIDLANRRISGVTGDILGPLGDGLRKVKVEDKVGPGTARLGRGSIHPNLVKVRRLRVRTKIVHLHPQAIGLEVRLVAMFVASSGATQLFIQMKNVM